ncbi:MAG: AbrB/MazE/SpoVT family DNA-binding domain-containing protein [Nitrososphaerota archaeon]
MSKPWYVLALLLTLALFIPSIHAEAFTMSINDDSVKIDLSYPTEVKPSTCFSIRVDVTALAAVSNLNVHLKVVYHADTSTMTLYDAYLVTSFTGGPGLVYSGVLTLCPPSTLGTLVSAKITVTYASGSLLQEFYMASVRSKYYSEVTAELDAAKSTISTLQSEVSSLRSTVETLRSEVNRLKDDISKLNKLINELELENELLKYKLTSAETLNAQLKERLSKLEVELSSVRNSYLDLSSEYAVLQDRYDSLLKSEESLRQKYESLSSDYNSLSKDYTMLTTLYNELKKTYQDLQARYESALEKIGSLQKSLKESEEGYKALSQQYAIASWEKTIVIWVAIAQAAGIAGFVFTRVSGFFKKVMTKKPEQAAKADSKEPSCEGEKVKEPEQKPERMFVVDRLQKVLSGRRISIPAEVAEKMGLVEGSKVIVRLTEDGTLTVRRAEESAENKTNEEAAK